MHEDVAARGKAGHVDVLTFEPRNVVVAVARRETFVDLQPLGLPPSAFLCPDSPPWLTGNSRSIVYLVAVAETEPGLVVAADGLPIEGPKLVALETEQMPVAVRFGHDESKPRVQLMIRRRTISATNELIRVHLGRGRGRPAS